MDIMQTVTLANELNRQLSKGETQMATKYLEVCPAFVVIGEMAIKTPLRLNLTPVRETIIKKTNNKYWQGCEERGNLFTAYGNVYLCSEYGNQYRGSLEN